jgi:UDP-GlcNAc:undecaprenyl-phosphate GlcNAc-1-phosphate transferase
MIEVFFLIIYSATAFIFLTYYKIISKKLKIIDEPGIKKIHKKPTPLIGGVIIFFLLIELFIYQYSNYLKNLDIKILIIISLICFFIGLLDDRINIKSYLKFFIISFAIFFLLNFSETLILKKLYFKSFESILDLNRSAIYLTILCILLLVNAYNLSDGINSLAVIIAIHWVVAIFYFIFGIKINYIIVPLLTLFILGVFIYRGKFFLGDSGSLLISSLIGLLTIYFYNLSIKNNNTIIPAENFFLVFIIPGLDMFRLFIERIFNKKDPFSGDKKHLHHLLIRKYKLRKTLLIYILILCLPFYLDYFFNNKTLYIILLVTLAYFYLIFFLKKNHKS